MACLLFCVFAFPTQVYAKDVPNTISNLTTFIETIKDRNANVVRGIYISNVMALAIVQQPTGNPGYVSIAESVATQFSMAAEVGTIGLACG